MTLSVSRKSSRFWLLSLSKTDRAPPSLQPQYRTFFATTECSVPVPRFGTQILVGLPLASLPSHRGDRFPRSTKEPRPCSRRLYAGRHLGRKQVSPTLFPEYGIYSDFDDFLKFSTPHQRFTFVRLHGPYLTVSGTAFFPSRSPPPLLKAAAVGGL